MSVGAAASVAGSVAGSVAVSVVVVDQVTLVCLLMVCPITTNLLLSHLHFPFSTCSGVAEKHLRVEQNMSTSAAGLKTRGQVGPVEGRVLVCC